MYTNPMFLEDRLVNHVPVQHAAMTADVFGIEVELEGKNILQPPLAVNNYWGCHNDNSLRKLKPGDECIEYVSIMPFDIQSTEKAIHALFKYLNSPGVEVYESYRTSIHVHVNFAMESFRTVLNFMAISIILDELLVSQNGEHRIGNNFCLRSRDAMGQIVSLVNSIQTGHMFFNLHANDRYSSINFASLLKFGSVEFRSMECNTHEGRIMHWINTLAQMKASAKKFKNPAEVLAAFSNQGPTAFLQTILGPYAIKYVMVEGHEDMLRNGARIAQDLAFCSTWTEMDAPAGQKVGKVKKLPPGQLNPFPVPAQWGDN